MRMNREYLVQKPHLAKAGEFGSGLLVVLFLMFVIDHPAECFNTVSTQKMPGWLSR